MSHVTTDQIEIRASRIYALNISRSIIALILIQTDSQIIGNIREATESLFGPFLSIKDFELNNTEEYVMQLVKATRLMLKNGIKWLETRNYTPLFYSQYPLHYFIKDTENKLEDLRKLRSLRIHALNITRRILAHTLFVETVNNGNGDFSITSEKLFGPSLCVVNFDLDDTEEYMNKLIFETKIMLENILKFYGILNEESLIIDSMN